MPKLTAPIRRKIERILKLQDDIARLAFEVEVQMGMEGVTDSDGYTIASYLDAGRTVPNPLDAIEKFTPSEDPVGDASE